MEGVVSLDYVLESRRDERTKQVVQKIGKLAEQEGIEIDRVFLHTNTDAEMSGSDDFVKGCMMVFDKDTKISESFLHANMFGQIMLFPVRKLNENGEEVPIEVSDFESRSSDMLDKLNYAVPQEITSKHTSEPSLRCLSSTEKIEDGEEWQSVLGKNGRIGLYRVEKTHDDYDYHLLVHVDQTRASLDLYRWVYSLPPGSMTLGEFINSTQYKFVQKLNQRNAQRLGAKAAEALGLTVDLIEDFDSFRSNKYKTCPKMAVPSIKNEYNVFQSGKWGNRPKFMLYDDTVCTRIASGGLLLMEDARSPVHMFPPTKKLHLGSFNIPGVTTNMAGYSFPWTLGQKKDTESFLSETDDVHTLMSDRQRHQTNQRVIWEGKPRNDKEKGAWFNHNVVSDLFLHYDPKHQEQVDLFSKLYEGDLSDVVTLKPVIVKISSEEYHGYNI